MLSKINKSVKHLYDTYVYLKIPCSLDVQIITLLSAEPEANCFPVQYNHVFSVMMMIGILADTRQCLKKGKPLDYHL